jgi:FKBP-type peptidyl-prolyl cis-trans isomerase 2
MVEKTKKNDFVEIEYIGRTDGEVFDSNIPKEVKKVNPQAESKPLIAAIGVGMVVKGLDKDLEAKEIGKKYIVLVKQEDAYGKRNPQMIRTVQKAAFLEHEMNPVPGMTVALDNQLAKIISVSGGRVMVDFNHPLAGKELEFEYTIKKKLTDTKEKINALQNFFFRKEFEFDLDDKDKKIIFKDLQLAPILNMFKDKFKELIGYDVEILAKKDKKSDK